MARGRTDRKVDFSLREFLVITAGAVAGMASIGLVEGAAAGMFSLRLAAAEIPTQNWRYTG